ncbi:hypothetical protein OH76DRAFT_1413512 [Lentinus brumalis]|uniref:Uncharacterized protein n=1 Tax=Lentinus brumalis TaxID=2498619 RepID=A0A371CGT9_9APHY|nr:hypothetical protein OH76DRAFT_1413512 [Polyporus brumalis]
MNSKPAAGPASCCLQPRHAVVARYLAFDMPPVYSSSPGLHRGRRSTLLPDYAPAVLSTSRTSHRRLVATLRHVSRLLITISDAWYEPPLWSYTPIAHLYYSLPASIARSRCALRACASLPGCQNTAFSAPGHVARPPGHLTSTSPSSRAVTDLDLVWDL